MSEKLLCTYCGTYNEPEAEYCGRCGHALERVVPLHRQDDAAGAKEGEEDLLQILMEEPVTKIPEEPAPVLHTPADKTHTQVFTRTELDAAIAAHETRKRADAAAREERKERYIEESLRYLEQEKRDREEMRLGKLRRQKEEELYAPFEEETAKQAAPPPQKKRKWWIPAVLILLALLVAGGVLGWKYFFNMTTVDLTRNIATQDIQIQGKDGEAEVILDEDLFRQRADYPRGNEKAEEFMQTVSYTVEPSSGISNGDTVTVRAIYSQETAKALHIDVKGEEKTFEVGGLEEKKTFNWDPLGLFTDDEDTDDDAAPSGEVSELITGETLIPGIDQREYTSSDVAGRDAAYIQAMVNELYARHGYIFKDKTLQAAYEKQSWYKGTTDDMAKVEASFNDMERANLSFLTQKAGQ